MCISLCIIAISKNPSAGRVLDVIRPVALISVLVKLTNRKSPNFYSFRRKLSTWPLSTWVSPRVLYMVCALSTGKQNYLSQQLGQVSAVATLDIAKAFDSVEYPVLLRRLPFIQLPPYVVIWVQETLSNREFFSSSRRFGSSTYP